MKWYSWRESIRKVIHSMRFTTYAFIALAVMSVFVFSMMYGTIKSETYELKLFQVAPETIRSVKTVEDTERTNEERERLASEVSPVYQYSEEIVKNRQAIANALFDSVIEAKTNEELSTSDAVKEIQKKLISLENEQQGFTLTASEIQQLMEQDIETLRAIQGFFINQLESSLKEPIRTEQLVSVREALVQAVRTSPLIPNPLQAVMQKLGKALLVETEVINEQLTNERIAKERAAVEPIRILQGQVIVREGQVIDNEILRQLDLAGLLDTQSSRKPLAGLGLFVIGMSSLIYLHFRAWRATPDAKKKQLTVVLVVYVLVVSLMKLISLIEHEFDLLIAFLFPTAFVAMLVKLLTNDRIALLATIITAATAGVLLQDSYASVVQMEVALYILFGGVVSIYLLGNMGRRSVILRASIGVACTNLVFLAFYLLMMQSTFDMRELLFYTIAAIMSGVLSGAMTIGLLPFFEALFFILSDIRLIELSNPNHPLFKKILTETPGTYHHSVMVANLADAACESVGANGLLARVGCYYHDIGKTVRPNYFIENQHAGQNPHDGLTPEQSKDIIIAHAVDGGKILEKAKMPRPIIDIAEQHHGTSLLKYFWHEAKQQGREPNESDFRYPGPKPQTREIAIISVADSVEAAVRSMKEPSSEKINTLVKAIISDKINDGQFDECELSLKDLKIVERVICETLNGIFHNRIEYPE